jgi:hypothetical protein
MENQGTPSGELLFNNHNDQASTGINNMIASRKQKLTPSASEDPVDIHSEEIVQGMNPGGDQEGEEIEVSPFHFFVDAYQDD